MDWNLAPVAADGTFLGLQWDFWKVLGWLGNGLFTSRFFVQWWATERLKRVVVPPAFWWLSMAGSGCLLIYGIHQQDSVFIFAYLFTWIPYIRNLVIGDRAKRSQIACAACEAPSPANAQFCAQCGVKLHLATSAAGS